MLQLWLYLLFIMRTASPESTVQTVNSNIQQHTTLHPSSAMETSINSLKYNATINVAATSYVQSFTQNAVSSMDSFTLNVSTNAVSSMDILKFETSSYAPFSLSQQVSSTESIGLVTSTEPTVLSSSSESAVLVPSVHSIQPTTLLSTINVQSTPLLPELVSSTVILKENETLILSTSGIAATEITDKSNLSPFWSVTETKSSLGWIVTETKSLPFWSVTEAKSALGWSSNTYDIQVTKSSMMSSVMLVSIAASPTTTVASSAVPKPGFCINNGDGGHCKNGGTCLNRTLSDNIVAVCICTDDYYGHECQFQADQIHPLPHIYKQLTYALGGTSLFLLFIIIIMMCTCRNQRYKRMKRDLSMGYSRELDDFTVANKRVSVVGNKSALSGYDMYSGD